MIPMFYDEVLKRNRAMADTLEDVSVIASKKGSVSDKIVFMVNKELRELDLLPQDPLGAQFYAYIEELVPPLRAGVKETQDFVKNRKRRG